MDVDSSMPSEPDQDPNNGGPTLEQPKDTSPAGESPVTTAPVAGPRCAPTYTVVQAVMEKKEDGPGPRCGHTLTAVPAVGEEGSSNYIGPRLILFGGATALEGNSAASAPAPSSPGSAGIQHFPLTDNNTNSPKSSPNKFEDPNGNGVGLGIVAAMSNNNHNSNNNKTAILAISPRLTSNPIPILVNNCNPKKNKEDMKMCEEYTCVISHKGNNLVKKREYFDDQFIGNGYRKKATAAAAASAPHEAFRTADFLNTCSFCQKQLQGLDIFIYRGEKAFCSSECRCKQISIDEQKDKCGSGAMKSPEYSASPCSGPMKFSTGVAVA